MMTAVRAGGSIPFNAEAASKMIYREAEMAGVDIKSLADSRSEGDKLRDWREAMLADPDDLWASTDQELEIARREMDFVDKHTGDIIAETRCKLTDTEGDIRREEARRKKGKAWVTRLDKLIRLRERARNPVPAGTQKLQTNAIEASHPLRFKMYVGRSSMKSLLHEGTESRQFSFGYHHCEFALSMWEARNGVTYPTTGKSKGLVKKRGRKPFKGIILIAPPGHGKSSFVMHYLALEIAMRPTTQAMYLHAILDEAKKNKAHIARMFTDDNGAGKRCLSLFPRAKLAKKGNNATLMQVQLQEKPKSPTLTAAAVFGAKLGADSDIQVLDDVVPQSDVDEPTVRERRFDVLSGTFGTRQRGTDTFTIVTGYYWHHDDAVAKMIRLAEKSGVFQVSIQTTGGPTSNPPFFPLWPDVYPEAELRSRFEQMNRNHSLWAANYEANPIAHADRLIRELAYYDPTEQEHTDFIKSATFYVSVDPAGTNQETSKTGKPDKVGILYPGVGEVSRREGDTLVYNQRVRILDAIQVYANQVELADKVASFALQRPVYQILVETRGGYHATADILENHWGLTTRRLDPGIRKKEVRLKQVAGLIDNSLKGMPAVVEFPGVRKPDGTVGPDKDRWGWLYKQFLDFGVESDDHIVDAASQFLIEMIRAGDIQPGVGEASVQIRETMKETGDPRILAMLKEYEKGERSPGPAGVADINWYMGRDKE